MRRFRLLLALGLLLLLVSAVAACADDTDADDDAAADEPADDDAAEEPADDDDAPDDEFDFSGEEITIFIGSGAGGGNDVVTRIMAEHLEKHLPGEDITFHLENLEGGGGEEALRTLAEADTPRDGTHIMQFHPRWSLQEALGEGPDFFDFEEQFVGATRSREIGMPLFVRQDVATSWEEVQELDRNLLLGSNEPGQTNDMGPALMMWKDEPVELVYGYDGTAEINAAVERGEVDGQGGTPIIIAYPEWAEEQFVSVIARWGPVGLRDTQDEDFQAFYDALGMEEEPPHIYDLLDLTDDEITAFEAATFTQDVTRGGIAVPPDSPPEVVELWAEVIEGVAQDEEWIQQVVDAGHAEEDFGYGSRAAAVEVFQAVDQLGEEDLELFRFLVGAE